MIPRIHGRAYSADGPLADALRGSTPVAGREPTRTGVVAHWAEAHRHADSAAMGSWSSARWATHLNELAHTSRTKAVFHLGVRCHPDDRVVSDEEWSAVAHRLARVAGIERPGDEDGCSWFAVLGRSGHLSVIASLVRRDGLWQRQPADVARRVMNETRRIEQDLNLISPSGHAPHPPVPTGSAQLAQALASLADEQSGPMAAARGLVEHTVRHAARQSSAAETELAHHLELIARRIYGIQQDLNSTADALAAAPPPRPPARPATRAR